MWTDTDKQEDDWQTGNSLADTQGYRQAFRSLVARLANSQLADRWTDTDKQERDWYTGCNNGKPTTHDREAEWQAYRQAGRQADPR